jgi:AmiR/NasT family two-component response regulator
MQKPKNDKYEELLKVTIELFNEVNRLNDELETIKQKLDVIELKNN